MIQLRYFAVYKPYGVVNQFTSDDNSATLASLYNFPKDVYPLGRLDKESEGLLLLTNDKQVNQRLLNPQYRHKREYWAQVDGDATPEAIQQLCKGVSITVDKQLYRTLPAIARKIAEPDNLPERIPPIRYRKTVPTSWISLTLEEGKNHQVRKMTAAVGFPTLRLIRVRIENIVLPSLTPALVIEIEKNDFYQKLFGKY